VVVWEDPLQGAGSSGDVGDQTSCDITVHCCLRLDAGGEDEEQYYRVLQNPCNTVLDSRAQ